MVLATTLGMVIHGRPEPHYNCMGMVGRISTVPPAFRIGQSWAIFRASSKFFALSTIFPLIR